MEESQRGRYGVLILAIALASLLLLGVVRQHLGQTGKLIDAPHRRPLKELVLETADGGTWRLSDHRGELLAINLWATWCGPCREETPMLVHVLQDLHGSGFAVVGVSLDDGDRRAKVRRFAQQYGVNYPLVFPDSLSQMEVGLRGLPTTLLLDRQGRVARIYTGEISEPELRNDLRQLLREPSHSPSTPSVR